MFTWDAGDIIGIIVVSTILIISIVLALRGKL